ncbi:hypothetical protein [Bacillus cereus]|uniref:hypothetical protein n=1 Tax=Bacillus TaxID=1386 RepID=UPI003B671B88
MYIRYKTEVKGITRNQKLRIPLNVNSLTHVELNFQETTEIGDNLFITFPFSTVVQTLQDAEKMTKPLLDNIINLLIFKFDVPIKKPSIHDYKVADRHLLGRGSITLHNQQRYELTDADCNWLDSEINTSTLSSKLKLNTYFFKYKSILTVEDEISRFLLLYGLLYEIKGSQASVDTYIKKKESNVKMLPSTKSGKSGNETIYTWWRNQAQHMQNSTDIEQVTQNFVKLVDPLQELVFNAIKDTI